MTRRQEITEMLQKQEYSAQDIANIYKTELIEIIDDLKHIKHSVKPKKLIMNPPFCKQCKFIFKERSKIKKPTKCPKCKSESIQAPLFRIE